MFRTPNIPYGAPNMSIIKSEQYGTDYPKVADATTLG
jgi:hypothetical protein